MREEGFDVGLTVPQLHKCNPIARERNARIHTHGGGSRGICEMLSQLSQLSRLNVMEK